MNKVQVKKGLHLPGALATARMSAAKNANLKCNPFD
jgi:hypothetical protein